MLETDNINNTKYEKDGIIFFHQKKSKIKKNICWMTSDIKGISLRGYPLRRRPTQGEGELAKFLLY